MTKIRPSTRQAIIEAAFQTLNQSPGASLEEIASKAGVGRATLHRHFRSRQDLILALAHTAIEELDEAISEATLDAKTHSHGLQLVMQAAIPLASRQWFLSQESLELDPEIQRAYERDRDELGKEIDAAKKEGSLDDGMLTPWLAEVFQNLIFSAWGLVRSGELTAKQAADLAWHTFIHGCGPKQ